MLPFTLFLGLLLPDVKAFARPALLAVTRNANQHVLRLSAVDDNDEPEFDDDDARLFQGVGASSSNNDNDNENNKRRQSEENVEYTGSIDWDSEWKKVVQNKNQPGERPGKDFYKSEAEIAAIKAANKAAEQAKSVTDSINLPSVPTSFDSVKGDWRVRC